MRKKLLTLLMAMMMCGIVGCTNVDSTNISNNKYMFETIENTNRWLIVYHVETKVMYAVSDYSYNCGNFTLLVDADGKPLLYEEDK